MIGIDEIARRLDAGSTEETAKNHRNQHPTLRGFRGAPHAVIAQVTHDAWTQGGWALPRAEDRLDELFRSAWEDGIVAIGLLAASVPDRPDDALEIAADWLDRVDDTATADTLGWLVLGPAVLAGSADPSEALAAWKSRARGEARRAAVMGGMALTTTPVEGPAAAALRARVGVPKVAFVEAARSDWLDPWCFAFLRDEDPVVRKALRRVLGAWAGDDPEAATAFIHGVKGGVPTLLREEVERAARKSRRKAARPAGS